MIIEDMDLVELSKALVTVYQAGFSAGTKAQTGEILEELAQMRKEHTADMQILIRRLHDVEQAAVIGLVPPHAAADDLAEVADVPTEDVIVSLEPTDEEVEENGVRCQVTLRLTDPTGIPGATIGSLVRVFVYDPSDESYLFFYDEDGCRASFWLFSVAYEKP